MTTSIDPKGRFGSLHYTLLTGKNKKNAPRFIQGDDVFEVIRETAEGAEDDQDHAYVGIRQEHPGRYFVTWMRRQRSGSFYASGADASSALKDGCSRAFGQTIIRTGPVFV